MGYLNETPLSENKQTVCFPQIHLCFRNNPWLMYTYYVRKLDPSVMTKVVILF